MKISKLLLLLLPLISIGCRDIFEKDISTLRVELISPIEGKKYESYTLTFWWKNLEEEDLRYKIQIVEGTFETPERLLVDTNVAGDKFLYTLPAGSHQWRVKAFNSTSETPFSTRNLLIDSSSIANNKVILNSPVNKENYFAFNMDFSWQGLPGVSAYVFQVDTITGSFAKNSMLIDTIVINSGSNINLRKRMNGRDGHFKWQVQGYDGEVSSQFSDIGEFVISTTPPVTNKPASPVVNPVNLTWKPLSGAVKYILYVQDSDRNNLDEFPKYDITGTSYEINEGITGDKFFWSVAGVDAFNNTSDTAVFKNYTLE